MIEDGRFMGIVTASDLAAALIARPDMPVGNLAQPSPMILRSGDTLEQAAVAMADPQTPLLPVIDPESGKLIGIVTRRDVLNAYRSRTDI